ncbi:restriction endonuclease subunit S [Pantoea cypripedii]|uniref:restriction endonuclease subunit S n=1 Tax=Pantoea cypripedii TaxID=55209 RepID=UPI002FCBCDB3
MNLMTVPLSSLFQIGSSKRVLKSQWKECGVPFYRGREVTRLSLDGYIDDGLFIAEEHYTELAAKYGVPNAGDIVITAIGTIGNSYVVQPNDKFYFKDASILWMKKTSEINSQYVNLWIKSPFFKKQLNRGNGATVDTLTIQKLQSIRINVPSSIEQERIVNILNLTFETISVALNNANKNRRNARMLYESLSQKIFSQNKEGWSKKQLIEICEISSTLVDPRNDIFLDSIHVGGANIESKTGNLLELKTAKEEGLISGKFMFDETMVLYSKIRPYLMKVARPNFQGLCSADIYPLSPKVGEVDRNYLFHMLLSPAFTNYANEGSARAGMPKVNREHLFSFSTNIPPLNLQKKMAASLDVLLERTQDLEALYQRKIDALDELKQSLLLQAFSGKL